MTRGFTEPEVSTSGSTFLKLDDGDKVVINLLDEPIQIKVHWTGGRSYLCEAESGECSYCTAGDNPKVRFGIAVYVHSFTHQNKTEPIGAPRIWEGGVKVLKDLVAVVTEFEGDDWKNATMTIKRVGAGMQDTSYMLIVSPKRLAIPADVDVPNMEEFYERKLAKQQGIGDPFAGE